jgi:hypothetical protein
MMTVTSGVSSMSTDERVMTMVPWQKRLLESKRNRTTCPQ